MHAKFGGNESAFVCFFFFFKASVGGATLLLLLLCVVPWGLQDFSSPTRDWIQAHGSASPKS